MATIRNPVNQNTVIDLSPALEVIKPKYGQYAESGLFTEQGIVANTHMYKVVDNGNTKMTELTSRVGREAMALDKGRDKLVTMGSITLKEVGSVHVEDLIGVSNGLFSLDSPTYQEETVRVLTRLANVGAANKEYLLTTATQGKVLDPRDGSVAIDQYANTGTAQATATITAAPTADIKASIAKLANQISELNGYNGNVGTIEVVLGETAFNAIVNHPDFAALYQLAFTGLGQQALQQPLLNGSMGINQRTQYGYRREFRWDNFLFVTYPQKFRRWDNTMVNVVAANKGWTIVHGVTGLYQVKYCPAPYVSTFNQAGTKWLARSTGIVDDTHTDITLETHLIPFMQRPEMAIDITVTIV